MTQRVLLCIFECKFEGLVGLKAPPHLNCGRHFEASCKLIKSGKVGVHLTGNWKTLAGILSGGNRHCPGGNRYVFVNESDESTLYIHIKLFAELAWLNELEPTLGRKVCLICRENRRGQSVHYEGFITLVSLLGSWQKWFRVGTGTGLTPQRKKQAL